MNINKYKIAHAVDNNTRRAQQCKWVDEKGSDIRKIKQQREKRRKSIRWKQNIVDRRQRNSTEQSWTTITLHRPNGIFISIQENNLTFSLMIYYFIRLSPSPLVPPSRTHSTSIPCADVEKWWNLFTTNKSNSPHRAASSENVPFCTSSRSCRRWTVNWTLQRENRELKYQI